MKLQPGDYVSTEGMTEEEYHAVCRAFIEAGAENGEYGRLTWNWYAYWGWHKGFGKLFASDYSGYFGRELTELTKDQILGAQKMTKVTVFGQTESRKEEKKIEFVYYLDSDTGREDPCSPNYWDNICLLGKDDANEFDLIMAWNNSNPVEKAIYLGHWNDGVV